MTYGLTVLFVLYVFSLIVGLASIIISHVYKEKDDRLFNTFYIGIATTTLGTITWLAAWVYVEI